MKRLLIGVGVVLMLGNSAAAQDFAKERLDKSPRHGEWVKVKQGTREVNSFLVFP